VGNVSTTGDSVESANTLINSPDHRVAIDIALRALQEQMKVLLALSSIIEKLFFRSFSSLKLSPGHFCFHDPIEGGKRKKSQQMFSQVMKTDDNIRRENSAGRKSILNTIYLTATFVPAIVLLLLPPLVPLRSSNYLLE
jgi:hypothetical protein